MSFPRYPKYKDSGVEWLGEVPEHWDVHRFKQSAASCRNGIWGEEPQMNEGDIPCVRVADFDRQGMRVQLVEPTIRNVPEKDRAGRLLKRGDLLLEKSGGGELQPVGFVVLYDDDLPAVCSNFVARVEIARGMDPSFWRYQHAAAYANRVNTKSIKQTSGIQNLDQQQYFDERGAFPPFDEQSTIARFLSRETGKIDALVTEQRRLIELLKEKRQAVISHAVTKGLNPRAPMKPSGIEWLGDVPQHWGFGPLKRFWEVVDCKHVTVPFFDDGYPVASVMEVRTFDLDLSRVLRTSEEYFQLLISGGRQPKGGDVIYCRNTANTGTSAYVGTDEPIAIGQDVVLIKSRAQNGRYLNYILHGDSMGEQLATYMVGSTFKRINVADIRELIVTCPPKEEQDEIVRYIEAETSTFDRLIADADRGIELLQERRTALISAAVTGKIDVRGLAETQSP
ncbi:MAG: restriction endonuclease subunit S [Planctomycetaceae bacterium]|nr:restriction endonuclease subunit S [Planctomycetaceae bacterium]